MSSCVAQTRSHTALSPVLAWLPLGGRGLSNHGEKLQGPWVGSPSTGHLHYHLSADQTANCQRLPGWGRGQGCERARRWASRSKGWAAFPEGLHEGVAGTKDMSDPSGKGSEGTSVAGKADNPQKTPGRIHTPQLL